MTSYAGRHADLYDLFYGDKPYEEEAAFVHRCLQKHGVGRTERLLEIACGTGSHAIALEKFGYKIIATDYSEDMLACARRKLIRSGASTDFRRQDMRALDIPEKQFDAAICLFDSIGYVQSNNALVEVLKGVNRHLREDGLFMFEFWHGAAMLRGFEPVRIRRWSTPEGEVLRIAETELECAEQLARVVYTIFELRSDGSHHKIVETQINRFFLLQEMAGWLSLCGFVPTKWFAGFNDVEKITEKTWHIVALARRSKEPVGSGGE